MPDREVPEDLGEEQRAGERAAKNTAVRAAGELAGRVASLVLFAGVARSLGEDGLGAFVLALAFLDITTTPIELASPVTSPGRWPRTSPRPTSCSST